MDYERQQHAPIYEALERFRKKRVVPFDVPGHKRGRGNPELAQLLGEKCVGLDVNSMKPLDNLCHPVSVIREAEELAADAFGAAHAFLMVGGTTSAVQSMILSVCKAGDKIILPRNVHKSAINALVLCGAIPVYVNPEVNAQLGISLGMEVSQVEKAMDENPDAVAVLVNNPTYYGICSDLRTIVKKAHARGMKVLADEAHGTHLYFGRNLPVSGMAAGADMAAVSMHKSGGSLTQSSLLLLNKSMNAEKVRQIINLTQTTSASYLLLSSLDISRRNLALRGEESFEKVAGMAQYAREEINEIGGYYAYGMDLINGTSVFDFDVTKLSIYTLGNGLAGIEVYDLLRDEYDIQIEFGDICNILAYISIGDRLQDIERLVGALADIERLYKKDSTGMLSGEYIAPAVVASPQQAFYAEKESLPMEQAAGRISGEFVMCYPPGIPILAPGEMVTQEIVEFHTGNVKLSVRINRQLFSGESEFQRIDVFESEEFGRFVALDGEIVFSDKDEFIYDEMVTHVPMTVHPNVKNVLIIGGGDGGVARELIHYQQIESIDVVESDKMFVDVCAEMFPDIAQGLKDERVNIYYEDGLRFLRNKKARYDLIINDSTDPLGHTEGLFTKEFYGSCYKALRDDGIMVYQHGSPFYDEDEVECRKMHRKVFRSFPVSRVYQAHIPTCPSGYWLFGFASKKYHPLEDFRPERFDNLNIETWYYTTNLHRGAFMLPKYVEDLLEEEENSL